jgi:hypothetical protein
MKIHVIIAQRKCSYQGEYGIEALHCMSEHEYSENPQFLIDGLERHRANGEFDSVEIVDLDVSEQDLRAVLFPSKTVVASVAGQNSAAKQGGL